MKILRDFNERQKAKSRLLKQARGQKFAMGGYFGGLGAEPPAAGGQWGSKGEAPSCLRLGVWGKAPSRRRHEGMGRSPQRSKSLHFFAEIT